MVLRLVNNRTRAGCADTTSGAPVTSGIYRKCIGLARRGQDKADQIGEGMKLAVLVPEVLVRSLVVVGHPIVAPSQQGLLKAEILSSLDYKQDYREVSEEKASECLNLYKPTGLPAYYFRC